MSMNINKEKFSDASISQDLGKSGSAQVDLFNGNLTFVHTDVQFNYGNPIISVGHVYSAKAQSSGAYGNNWSLNCDEKIEIASDGSYLKYVDASGSAAYYYPLKDDVVKRAMTDINVVGNVYYASPSNPTGGFAVSLDYGMSSMYDEKANYKYFDELVLSADGRVYTSPLTSIMNSDGKMLTYNRDENNKLSYIVDESGRYVDFYYTDGKLTGIADSAGRSKTFEYINNRLVRIQGTLNDYTEFTYNSDNCITKVTNGLGVSYEYTYDSDGRVKTVTKTSLYDKIANGYESEEENKTYEVTTLSYGNTTSHKDALPAEKDQEQLTELSKGDNPMTCVSTNSGLNYVYYFKTENKLFYFNGMSYECDKLFYVTEGNSTYKTGIAKNVVHLKTALNGESIDVQTYKNNYLKNAFFDNTQMDANGYVTPEDWSITPLNSSMISYNTMVDETTALKIPGNGTEYTVSQEVADVIETSSAGNVYHSLNSGLYTIAGWVKSGENYDKRDLSLELVYGTHVVPVTFNDYEVAARIGTWEFILKTVYVADKKEINYNEERLNKIIVKIKYKGNASSGDMLVDRMSLTAQQTSITESDAKLLTLDIGGHVINTYSIEDIDMAATRSVNSTITIPEDFTFTIPFLMNAVIKYPPTEEESEEEENSGSGGRNYDIAGLGIVFARDGSTERCCLANIEVQLGGTVRKADSQFVTQITNDEYNNPVLQQVWHREKHGNNYLSFDTYKMFDDKFREISLRDYRDITTDTDYDDNLTNPTKTVSTYYNSAGPWIRNIATLSADKGATVKEQGENRTYTTYTYNSGNGDADFVNDKLYGITYDDGSYAKYTYDAEGNIATMIMGKNNVEHSYTYEYTMGLMTKVTTDSNDVFTYDYDGLGQTISIKHNGTELVSHKYYYRYEAGFLPYKITVKFGKKYRTQFDAYGNPTEIYEYTNVNATTAADEILKLRMVYDSKTNECVEIKDYTNTTSSNVPSTVISTENTNNKVTFNSTGESVYSYTKRFDKELLKEEEKTVNGDTTYMQVTYEEDANKGRYPDDRIIKTTLSNDGAGDDVLLDVSYGYDTLGRVETVTVKADDSADTLNTLWTKTNVYRTISNKTGNFIQDQTVVIPNTQYGEITRKSRTSYDYFGNVTLEMMVTNTNYPFETIVTDTGSSVSTKTENLQFKYDGNGKLIREDSMKADYSSFTYEYDTEGNITKKSVYKFTTAATPTTLKNEYVYTYDSLGRLSGYGNKVIGNYDAFGNPRLYKGSILSWNGARLSEMAGSVFTYDGKGYRTRKYVSATNSTHNYTYDEDGQILSEKITDQYNESTVINYFYDGQGVAGFKLIKEYNDEKEEHSFYYIKDILGNIRHIVDKDSNFVVSYYYDGWGNIYPQYHSYMLLFAGTTYSPEDISNLNGLFYKGYYYDKETKLYYLTTRYYDPEIGRFISPDDPKYLDFKVAYGYNRYAYCNNNPVMGYDPKGTFALTSILFSVAIGALIGAAVSFVSTMVEDLQDDGKAFNGSVSWQHYLGSTIGGAIAGAGTGFASGLGSAVGGAMLVGEAIKNSAATFLIGSAVSFGAGAAGYIAKTVISDKESFHVGTMFLEGFFNMTDGMISYAGGMVSEYLGTDILDNEVLQMMIGATPLKFLLTMLKEGIKEIYS